MILRRRAKPVPLKPAEPVDTRTQKARHLPMFGPGLVITVPLGLLPEYFQLYQLEPQGLNRSGILIVKRNPSKGENDHDHAG